MTKIIFSFDTEDYIDPGVDDFTKRICEVFDANDMQASFVLVAERARKLVKRGRLDVIDALNRHEIGYHSYYHSMHPNVAEYLDEHDWAGGVREFLGREREGTALVQEIFGREKLWAAVPAGNSWGPQMVYGYSGLGIPIQAGSALHPPRNWPHHYIGQIHIQYTLGLDHLYTQKPFEDVRAALDKLIAQEPEYIVTCDHPTFLLHSQFVDVLNFGEGKNIHMGDWEFAPERPKEEQERALDNMDRLLKYVKNKTDLEPTSYQAVHERFRETPGGRVSVETAVQVAEHAAEKLESCSLAGASFSAADQFGILNYAVAHLADGKLPDAVPLRRLLGPVESIVDDQEDFGAPLALVENAATQVEGDWRGHVPNTIVVEDHQVGPGTFLKGLARVVLAARDDSLPESIPFDVAPRLPAESEMDGLRDVSWLRSWACFDPEFAGVNLQRHAKLQTWSIRPAVER